VVIVKKLKNVPIKKSIAAIFRKYNLIEYKSPGATIFSVQKEEKGGIVKIYSKGGNTYEQDTRITQAKDFRSHC
jgi:hypothetical protein